MFFLLDLLIDIGIGIYTSLGFGSKEYKINTKMDKLKEMDPDLYVVYQSNKARFEKTEPMATMILEHPVKTKEEKQALIAKIMQELAKDEKPVQGNTNEK